MGDNRLLYLVRICSIAVLGGLLFGYDTAVINGVIGLLEQHFTLTPALKGWAASSALLGCVLGVAMAGTICDRYGRKPALPAAGYFFWHLPWAPPCRRQWGS
jgi:MFS family permease